MKTVLFYKILAFGLAVLLLLVGAMFALLISQAIRELDNFKKQQVVLAKQLDEQKIELQRREEFLEKLQTDPDFLERIARLRLGYAKPDELILRFDTDPFTSAPPPASDIGPSISLPTSNVTTPGARGSARGSSPAPKSQPASPRPTNTRPTTNRGGNTTATKRSGN